MDSDLEIAFRIIVRPKQVPYSIFIDDTLRNFSASSKVLGLLAPSSVKTPDEMPNLTFFAKKVWKNENLGKSYDSNAGIPTNSFYALTNHAIREKNNIGKIVLDWDKTLTTNASFKSVKITKYTAECYLGGCVRMRAISHFFKQMSKHKIAVEILTSNGRARYDTSAFRRLLKFVHGGDVTKIVYTDQNKVQYLNKFLD